MKIPFFLKCNTVGMGQNLHLPKRTLIMPKNNLKFKILQFQEHGHLLTTLRKIFNPLMTSHIMSVDKTVFLGGQIIFWTGQKT
jgi:hypothetical protein